MPSFHPLLCCAFPQHLPPPSVAYYAFQLYFLLIVCLPQLQWKLHEGRDAHQLCSLLHPSIGNSVWLLVRNLTDINGYINLSKSHLF